MGLFSRKSSSKNQNNNNNSNHSIGNGNMTTTQDNASNGSLKTPTGFPGSKRMNSNPASSASIPDIPLPRAPDPNLDPSGYLRSIYAVRERSKLVLEKAKRNQLRHFTVDMTKFEDTARFVVSIIKVCQLTLCG